MESVCGVILISKGFSTDLAENPLLFNASIDVIEFLISSCQFNKFLLLIGTNPQGNYPIQTVYSAISNHLDLVIIGTR